MNLHPDLLSTLTSLGITDTELDVLRARMLSVVTGLEATANSLNSQITTLQSQLDLVMAELDAANVTVKKLIVV